jgi:hypothetical protein
MREKEQISPPRIESVTVLSSDKVEISIAEQSEKFRGRATSFKVSIQSSESDTSLLDLSLNSDGRLLVKNLEANTLYKFSVAAKTADGLSPFSIFSEEVRTSAYLPAAVVTPTQSTSSLDSIVEVSRESDLPLLFTLDSESYSTLTYRPFSITPVLIRGSELTWSMTPTPQGLSINTTTGVISGIPRKLYSAETITIVARNTSFSYSKSFLLTVTNLVIEEGQRGPGGGYVFYKSRVAFKCGPKLENSCYNLEYAPKGWSGTELDPIAPWSSVTDKRVTAVGGNGYGAGLYSSMRILEELGDTQSAVALARDYRGGGFDDWYLPNVVEIQRLAYFATTSKYPYEQKLVIPQTLGSFVNLVEFERNYYWVSYGTLELDASSESMYYYEFETTDFYSFANKYLTLYAIRPIRAF